MRFEHYNVNHGLSQSGINCMHQDSRGFLWFGTQDGLNRFDGFEFVIFRYDPNDTASLSDNTIYCMEEDSNGFLWIGTQNGGLNRLSLRTCQIQSFASSLGGQPGTDRVIRCLHLTGDRLWMGTLGAGLQCFHIESETFLSLPDLPEKYRNIYHIIEYDATWLWLLTGRGLIRFNRFTFEWSEELPANLHSALDHDVPTAMRRDRQGNIWIGGHHRMVCVQPDGKAPWWGLPVNQTNQETDFVNDLIQDRDGFLWVAMNLNGLLRFNLQTKRFEHYRRNRNNPGSLSFNQVNCLLEDASGLFWVGTELGLDKWNPLLDKFHHSPLLYQVQKRLAGDDVWAFLRDSSGRLWIGTSQGLFQFSPQNRFVRQWTVEKDGLRHRIVLSLLETRDGGLWVGTYRGLHVLDAEQGELHAVEDSVLQQKAILCLRSDPVHEDEFWVGTTRGLYRYRYISNQSRVLTLGQDDEIQDDLYISCLYVDKYQRLWIGTGNNGFFRKESFTDRLTHITYNSHRLSSNRVTCVLEDRKGVIWVGTFGGGMCRLDATKQQFENFHLKHGLPNAVIYGILEDDSNCLWISTNQGISRFDKEKSLFVNYDQSYGLQDNEFNQGAYYRDDQGIIYLGGVNGFNAFAPDSVILNHFKPPVVITDVNVFHESVMEGADACRKLEFCQSRSLTLPHQDNFVTFTFAALDFHSPERNQFMYRLDPVDTRWNHARNFRTATYARLAPGKYRFRVKGSNDDGIWNEEASVFQLTIRPGFLASPTFRIMAVLLLLVLVLGGHYSRIRWIQFRATKLEREVRQRTQDLTSANVRLKKEIEHRQKIESALRLSEDRYRNFLSQSAEGIFRIEFDPPVNTALPEEEQVNALYAVGFLAECNLAFAQMYGFDSPDAVVGKTMSEFHGGVHVEENRQAQRDFIQAGYRIVDSETHEKSSNGEDVYFLNNSVGIVKDGFLLRAWGTQRDITQRKRADAHIKTSLKEKEVLLKEIHHRVKNNMQIISSLLHLQSRKIENREVRDLLHQSRARVRSMALVHEMLYGSDNLSSIHFADYVEKLIKGLRLLYGEAMRRVRLNVQIDPLLFPVDLAIPCGLVINELLTNSLKHAFPGTWQSDCRIDIQMRRIEENDIELTYCDSGIGFPDDFNLDDCKSLGLHLVKILVEDQLEGSLNTSDSVGVGFVIRFQIHNT